MPPFDLKITRGLSQFDCQDHHAILGIPIHADQKVIRKRYLKIARRLHPDSVPEGVNKETASRLLSKLINPSYEFLSNAHQMEEYGILLKLIAQRFAREQQRFPVISSEGQELLRATDLEQTYHAVMDKLADQQFDDLAHYSDLTGTISEVNLVYIYRQENPAIASSPAAPSRTVQPSSPSFQSATSSRSTSSVPPAANPRVTRSTNSQVRQPTPSASQTSSSGEARAINYDLVNQYYRRAEDLISKNCYLEAIRELKEVVEGNNPIDPNNSKVYTLLGDIYMDYMKQPVMAKPFYLKALKADPENDAAKKQLGAITPTTTKPSSPNAKSPGKSATTGTEKKKFGFFNFLSRKK